MSTETCIKKQIMLKLFTSIVFGTEKTFIKTAEMSKFFRSFVCGTEKTCINNAQAFHIWSVWHREDLRSKWTYLAT